MHTRLFDHADRAVSEVGLGCWQLGGSDWGDLSEDRAFNILQTAVDHGVDFFDTADVYGGGRSEELIGRFLRERKASVFVASKLGRYWEPGGAENFTDAVIRLHTEASLRRTQLDALDLTQLHCVPVDVLRQGDVFESLRALKHEGKIKAFGASVEATEDALTCLEQDGLASLQVIFNIFRQKPITTIFDKAQEKGVALIVRLPLASGLLSGKLTKSSMFPQNDHRQYNRDGQAFNVGETFAGLPFELGVDLADGLKPLVPEGMTMAQMSLRWILDFPAVTTIIPGASRPEQATSNASVSGVPPLSPELHDKLRTFYETQVANNIRGPY